MKIIVYLSLLVETIWTTVAFEERTSLAELPLDKLLHFKQALAYKNFPELEAYLKVRGDHSWRKKMKRRTSGGDSTQRTVGSWKNENAWKGKGKGKGGTQSIFLGTVTVLSFLAFGGYLLCLIIHAIRMKQMNMGATTTMAPAAAIIVGKRKKRQILISPNNYYYLSDINPQFSTDELIETLIVMAEGYTKFETMNNENDI